MSLFDGLLAAVWSEAREDGGVLLAEFAALPSDRARAERVLRMPQLARVRERLADDDPVAGRKDARRAAQALARAGEASERKRDLEAVLELSEAIRFLSEEEQLVDAMERRAHALLGLHEAAASLQDLRRVLQATQPEQHLQRHLRTLLAMSSCLELQRDWSGAEAVLRQALEAVRNPRVALQEAAVKEALGDIVQRLKRVADNGRHQRDQDGETPQLTGVARSRVASGLDALPKLFGGPHPTLPSAAAVLQVRVDKKRGRHLVTTKLIPAGGVLILERPYAWSLVPHELPSHCLYCCAPVLAPLPCPHCSNVVFCSADCLSAALPSFHLAECAVLDHLSPRAAPATPAAPTAPVSELSAMALLVYRIVVQATGVAKLLSPGGAPGAPGAPVQLPQDFVDLFEASGAGQQLQQPGKKARGKAGRATKCSSLAGYGAVFDQVTHSGERSPADVLKRSVTAAFLTCCLDAVLRRAGLAALRPEQAAVLTSAFLRHLQSCSCNAYQIAEQRLPGGSVRAARGLELGGACYPTVSLVNHACSPNVVRHSHGSVCVVRAVCNIPEGTELLDNYGPHFLELEREERQAELARQYFFRCDCEACRRDWPTLQELLQEPKQTTKAELCSRLSQAVQGMLEGRLDEALRAALRYAAVLEPPSAELARANQVASLCWSLAGNRVYY